MGIRVRLPKVEVKVVNGKEVYTFPGYRCMCDQGFLITLRAKGTVLLSLTIKHGQNALSEVGDFGLEEAAFKPFNDQILERAKKANQAPGPAR